MSREQSFNIKDIIAQAAEESLSNDTNVATDFSNKILQMADQHDNMVKDSESTIKSLDPNEVQGEYYAWDDISDKTITIPSIKDTQGYLSQKVQAALDKYHISTIPVSVVGILEQVTELQDHSLIDINGVKYAMSNTLNEDKVVGYRNAIYTSLSSGLPYKKSLFIDVDDPETDNSFRTLDLIKTEWDYICSIYKNYNPRLVITEDNDFVLAVG